MSEIDDVLHRVSVCHVNQMADPVFAQNWSQQVLQQTLVEAAFEAGMMYEATGNDLRAEYWLQKARDYGSACALQKLDRAERPADRGMGVLLHLRPPAATQRGTQSWRLPRLRAGRRAAASTTILAAICALLASGGGDARAFPSVQLAIGLSGLFVCTTAIWVFVRRCRERLGRRMQIVSDQAFAWGPLRKK